MNILMRTFIISGLLILMPMLKASEAEFKQQQQAKAKMALAAQSVESINCLETLEEDCFIADIAVGKDDNGKTLIALALNVQIKGSGAYFLKLRDLEGRNSITPPTKSDHTDDITSVEIGKDDTGKTIIASGSLDKTVKLWDAAGKCFYTISGYYGCGVKKVKIGKNDQNKTVVTAICNDGGCYAWNIAQERMYALPKLVKFSNPVTLKMNSTGEIITVSRLRSDKKVIVLSDASGENSHTLKGHNKEVTALALDNDSNGNPLIVSASNEDGVIKIWGHGPSEASGKKATRDRCIVM